MKKKISGFTLVEITVALGVVGSLALMLIAFSNTSVKTANKTVAYLQALQLAYETIEWIKAYPADLITDNEECEKLSAALSGSIVDISTMEVANLPTGKVNDSSSETIQYPKNYAKQMFNRQVTISRLTDEGPRGRFLLKVSVKVMWSEGEAKIKGDALEGNKADLKNITLTTTILDEFEYY